MDSNNYSLSDIRAATDGMDGFGAGGGSWLWIIVLFVLFAGGGFGGWGNNGATTAMLTQAQLYDGLYNQTIDAGMRQISTQQMSNHEAVLQAQCELGQMGLNNRYELGTQIMQSRFDAAMAAQANTYETQRGFCDTNRNIDSVKFENAQNTSAITNAIHTEGEQTRALINANTMQALRDKLEDKDRELLAANFNLSQQAQTSNLIDQLRPCARPAYITCSPYTTNSGCGCAGVA